MSNFDDASPYPHRKASQLNGHESVERPPINDQDKQEDYAMFLYDLFTDLREDGADPEMLQNLMDAAVLYAMHAGRRESIQHTASLFRAEGGEVDA
jgi:hypothetical protein